MKGKRTFPAEEIEAIKQLINKKVIATKEQQQRIRDEIRDDYGFYYSEFSPKKGYTVSDLQVLIDTNKIIVVENPPATSLVSEDSPPVELTYTEKKSDISSPLSSDLRAKPNSFSHNRFDPNADSESKIEDKAGNYFICLSQGSKLPPVSIEPKFIKFEGLDVIYTGIASSSLRIRDYRQHFIGNNAGRSTLRKSLGVLFGYKQVPRDNDPTNGKTKFGDEDEVTLSDWMKKNLIMFFLPTKDYESLELKLINNFNPPLNLKDNHNVVNTNFRKLLSTLREQKKG